MLTETILFWNYSTEIPKLPNPQTGIFIKYITATCNFSLLFIIHINRIRYLALSFFCTLNLVWCCKYRYFTEIYTYPHCGCWSHLIWCQHTIWYFSISASIVWSNLSQCSCDNPSRCTAFRKKEPKILAPGHREDHSWRASTVSKNLVCKQKKEIPVFYTSFILGFIWVRSNCAVRLPREVFEKHVHIALRNMD